MKVDLSGRVALVTAASSGIGLGIAKTFRASGARVAICGRDGDRLERALGELGGGDDAIAVAGDLADEDFPGQLVAEVVERLGDVDILVTNSGGPPASDPLAPTAEQWAGALSGNLMSVVRLTTLVAGGMQERGWGRIIHLTSMSAKEPDPGLILSNVTRAAVAAYSKTLAAGLAPNGVTVNTVLTGGVLTERVRQLVAADVGADQVDAEIERIGRELIPAGRFATPDEFASTILYLASDEAWYVSGVALPVDGAASKTTF
jgi:3-oxoacyl-[acyl-carrier protein] reductase